MKINIILIALNVISINTFGQASKQIARIYEQNKYKEVIALAGKADGYLSGADEKLVDDLVGRSYYALQNYDSTIYFENKALSLDNDATSASGWAYIFMGKALYRQGKKEESIRDLKQAIELNKSSSSVEDAKEFLSNINNNSVPSDDKYKYYFSQGEYKSAIEEGRKQLQKQEYSSVMEIMGASYYHIHNYDSAIYFERKVLAVNDSSIVSDWAHTYLGMALYRKNEKGAAIEELRKAIELNKAPNAVHMSENFLDDIINGRALAIDSLHQDIKDKLNGNDYRAAAGTALAFLAANPGDAMAWGQLTAAYCLLHNYDSSLYCGQRAIAIDKDQSLISCETHYRIGIDRFMKNDREAAKSEFAAAINDHINDNLRKKIKHAEILMGLDDMYAGWKTIEKDNIIFHFQNKRSIDDVDALMEKYEKEYDNAQKVLPVSLPKKIDIFVWERDALAQKALQNDKDIAYTNAGYCLMHVAQDNNRSPQIVYILGYWQKNAE